MDLLMLSATLQTVLRSLVSPNFVRVCTPNRHCQMTSIFAIGQHIVKLDKLSDTYLLSAHTGQQPLLLDSYVLTRHCDSWHEQPGRTQNPSVCRHRKCAWTDASLCDG